jgi:hypothetical protein
MIISASSAEHRTLLPIIERHLPFSSRFLRFSPFGPPPIAARPGRAKTRR